MRTIIELQEEADVIEAVSYELQYRYLKEVLGADSFPARQKEVVEHIRGTGWGMDFIGHVEDSERKYLLDKLHGLLDEGEDVLSFFKSKEISAQDAVHALQLITTRVNQFFFPLVEEAQAVLSESLNDYMARTEDFAWERFMMNKVEYDALYSTAHTAEEVWRAKVFDYGYVKQYIDIR